MGNRIADEILMHYGMPKRSGRYPYGSGEDPNQHSGDFNSRVDEMIKKGMSETEIAENLGLTTGQYRTQRSLARAERRGIDYAKARALRDKGYSLPKIAEEMGYASESSVRSLLNTDSEARMSLARKTADIIKKEVDEKGMVEIGLGVERELGVSREKMAQSTYMLELEGYPIYKRRVPQATNPGKFTTVTVLCKPGTEYNEIYDTSKIKPLSNYHSQDGGDTFDKAFVYPKSMDSSRLAIRYAEDGGIHKDGLIELRRGVEDISLGKSSYAQVRILVDGNKYIKGMAVYADDLPPGVDVRFNTNKSNSKSKLEVLKDISADPANPFGSLIKAGGQRYYTDADGNRQLSLINKRAEEGDWGDWNDKLPAQFLAKQNDMLIKRQLKLTSDDKYAEFDAINALENPTIKKVLLKSFADDCDAAAVHLKAAALPGQKYQVILPFTTIKDTEVFAPNFEDGSKVALVRFPHGGTFEIPILTVNNKNKEALKILGATPKDAVGINSKVAERLSGADFDGDTVMVVPTGKKVNITSTPALKDLEGFDNKLTYGATKTTVDPDGTKHYFRGDREFKVMNNTQIEMGKISNLITDMTLKGAKPEELARAVKHSMVVIDAEKHKLDYTQSYLDNGIASLKKLYLGSVDASGKYHEGASTLISRAKSPQVIDKRRGQPWINETTGEYEWERINPKTGQFESKIVKEEYVDKKGKVRTRTQESTKMYETKDAHTLSSGTRQEEAYADYANQMKSLGNLARKTMLATGKIETNPEAKLKYKEEVKNLKANLNIALMNAPRERQAQILTTAAVNARVQANPDMTKAEIKKAKQQELTKARLAVGAKRQNIDISDREWEAIQSGAISENTLMQIINNSDKDQLKQRATPRTYTALTQAKINKIASMKLSGYTTEQIAKSIGVSPSTVRNYI